MAVARTSRLKSYGTWMAVVKTLESYDDLKVTEEDFDRDPWLLNTPAGYVDLRELKISPHDPDKLMRRMTCVAPDMRTLHACIYGGTQWKDVIPLYWMVSENLSREPTPEDAPELGEIRPGFMVAQDRVFGYSFSGSLHHQAIAFIQGIAGIGKTQIFEAGLTISGSYGHGLTDNFINKTDDGKRFDTMQLIGIRFAFMDETRAGATFDDTRMSKVAASKFLVGEIKGGRVGVEFKNTTKLLIVGNHRPHIQNGLTGGLTSRMLLFEAGGKNYRNRTGETGELGERIVNGEGPQLLAYFIWQAYLDYVDYTTNGSAEWRKVVAPMREAAETYTRESSFIHEWAAAHNLVEADGLLFGLTEAHQSFVDYAQKRGNRSAQRMAMPEFKDTMRAAFKSIDFKGRTARPNHGRTAIRGFGRPLDRFDNVTVLDKHKPAATETKTVH